MRARPPSKALTRPPVYLRSISHNPIRLSSSLATSANAPTPQSDVATPKTSSSSKRAKGVLFIDSILPIKLGLWDIRPFLAAFRNDQILDSLDELFHSFSARGFELLEIEPPR